MIANPIFNIIPPIYNSNDKSHEIRIFYFVFSFTGEVWDGTAQIIPQREKASPYNWIRSCNASALFETFFLLNAHHSFYVVKVCLCTQMQAHYERKKGWRDTTKELWPHYHHNDKWEGRKKGFHILALLLLIIYYITSFFSFLLEEKEEFHNSSLDQKNFFLSSFYLLIYFLLLSNFHGTLVL